MEKVIAGNFELDAKRIGPWVMGYGIDSSLNNDEVAIKWSKLVKGDKKAQATSNKVSKTIAILISGKFRVSFPDTLKDYILEKPGDYLYLPPHSRHTSEALEDVFLVTVRWPAVDDQY